MEGSFQTVKLGNIHLHVLPSKKFKTTSFAIFLEQKLDRETLTKHSLLANVLQRGTSRFPSSVKFRRKLEELYGAGIFADVLKKGESHILQIGMDIANEQYLKTEEPLLEQGIQLLVEVLTSPATEENHFPHKVVDAEKKVLKQRIESLQDDKIRYAAIRCSEEMCKGEPYALFGLGKVEDLPTINGENLYTYYQEMLKACPMDIYCVGNVDISEVKEYFEKYMPSDLINSSRTPLSTSSPVQKVPNEEKVVVDRMDVQQGKLNLGLRTQITFSDEEYPALVMYNGILGGFPHSKLFRNVREKESLAYYCSSRIESLKGLLFIQSGIEISNYEKAVQIIKDQLQALRQGDISDNELEQTKATLSNQYRQHLDRPFDLIGYHFHQRLGRKERQLENFIHQIQQITKDDVQRVAQKVKLDTIYFLRDQGGEQV